MQASLLFDADKYYGIEINSDYCNICCDKFRDPRFSIINEDFFSFDLRSLLHNTANALIIGNPPWITSSSLSAIESDNIPQKTNFKGLKGIDALTGASNFDICEYIILKLIYLAKDSGATISMLCKTSVARNVLKELNRSNIGFEYFDILEFNAAEVFGIRAQTCVLLIKLSPLCTQTTSCNVYSSDNWEIPKYSLAVDGEHFQRSLRSDYDFGGKCCFEWRQGVKHDCSKVMELSLVDGLFHNKEGHIVDIESTAVYPLAKSSTFKKPIINSFSKYVLVTQKEVGQDTSYLQEFSPKTWKYLNDNIDLFERRKSSIYRLAPPFAMFGVGAYSYSQFKVGVSGFYKTPLFSLLYSPDGKPVMTDDTSYFICFDHYNTAYVAMLLLNSKPVQEFLMDIAFLDAKRPYTKKVLERLCFKRITSVVTFEMLLQTEHALDVEPYITKQMYSDFQSFLDVQDNEQTELMQIS